MTRDRIDYVLGADVGIAALLDTREIVPFLEESVALGLWGVQVCDRKGEPLWEAGCLEARESHAASLFLEGEPVGWVRCTMRDGNARIAAGIMACALNVLLYGSLKRKLTTEVHTQAINQSYDELVESEQRYRELAASLEIRVQERTLELQRAYNLLLQQEKLASVGQLAAGIAHEINNPLGFILSNFSSLEKYVERLQEMLLFCRSRVAVSCPPEMQAEVEARWKERKIDLLLNDAVELIQQSREGGERVKKIVSDLRGFSHIDHVGNELFDINTELMRTLNVMTHEVPADASIIRDFAPLPEYSGNPAQFCQAFYNLIRNAFQCRPQGLVLTMSSRYGDGKISLVFADNGPGIPESVQSRIFEPFFTTRVVGEGMGLGLSMVYDVVSKAGGTVTVDSRVGEGSRFTIELPCRSATHG